MLADEVGVKPAVEAAFSASWTAAAKLPGAVAAAVTRGGAGTYAALAEALSVGTRLQVLRNHAASHARGGPFGSGRGGLGIFL